MRPHDGTNGVHPARVFGEGALAELALGDVGRER